MAAISVLPAYRAASRVAAYSVPIAGLGVASALNGKGLKPRQIIAMAAALAGPLLSAELSALVGLGSFVEPSKEEVFAPFCGKWIKDKDTSDSMVPCCQLLGFNALLQHAVRLIRGLEITMHSGCINVSVCSFISWFKITERYPIDGSEVKNNRRDMRGGGMSTRLKDNGDKAHLSMQWGGSYAGGGEDVLYMPNPNELHITTKVWVAGDTKNSKSARVVYKRAP